MSSNDYFEAIGLWPRAARHMERTYVLGFLFSLALTFGAYVVTVRHMLAVRWLIPLLLIAAALQFMVQVLNFLHVGGERSSRDRLITLGCTVGIMLILVVGSVWVMATLDTRMALDPAQMQQYMQRQQGF